jgi:hypothetical protein
LTDFNLVTYISYPSIKTIAIPTLLDDENFSREVALRTKLLVSSKFGEGNMLDALSLDELDNAPQLSQSEAFSRMLQKENTLQARAVNMDMEEDAVEVVGLAIMKAPHSTSSIPRLHDQAEAILSAILAEVTIYG